MPEVFPTGAAREAEIEVLVGELSAAGGRRLAKFEAFLELLISAQVLAEEPGEVSLAVRQRRADRALARLRKAAEACR